MEDRQNTRNIARPGIGMLLCLIASLSPTLAQVSAPPDFLAASVQSTGNSAQILSPLITLTFQDALKRAQRNDPTFQSAVSNAKLAHEDRIQSRAAPFPTLGLSSQYLNTQGNDRIPTGRYVTQDGVHVYREWSVVRQDLSPATLLRTDYRHARVAEAVSQTKAEKARLALAVTVVKTYYGLLVAQHKYATAQQALDQANRFVALGLSLERSGRKPHSDVVKFQLQQTAEENSLREAILAMERARLDLAVLLFRDFDETFEIVDDLRPDSFRSFVLRGPGDGPD